MRANN